MSLYKNSIIFAVYSYTDVLSLYSFVLDHSGQLHCIVYFSQLLLNPFLGADAMQISDAFCVNKLSFSIIRRWVFLLPETKRILTNQITNVFYLHLQQDNIEMNGCNSQIEYAQGVSPFTEIVMVRFKGCEGKVFTCRIANLVKTERISVFLKFGILSRISWIDIFFNKQAHLIFIHKPSTILS